VEFYQYITAKIVFFIDVFAGQNFSVAARSFMSWQNGQFDQIVCANPEQLFL